MTYGQCQGLIGNKESIVSMSKRYLVGLLGMVTAFGMGGITYGEKEFEVKRVDEGLPGKVTFSKHVAGIIYKHCAECHRPGQSAPFSLLSYKDVKKRSRMIRRVTRSRYMPPWHPVEGHGSFVGSRRLSQREIDLIGAWVDGGALAGDLSKAPTVPKFASGWRLGKPDIVVEMTKGFVVPASGPDIYRNFVIPLNLKKDEWVRAVEVRPSARTVVHHVLFYLDNTGKARRLDGRDGRPGFRGMGFRYTGSLGGWAVGGGPYEVGKGLAMPLAKRDDLVLETHFHPSGKEEIEKTKIAIYLAKKEPERKIHHLQLPAAWGLFAGLNIPAGAKNFKVSGSYKVDVDMDLVTVGAHAHYLGKTMRAWAVHPDGRKEKLFYVDKWDFNWQGNYIYKKPVRLKKGTIVYAELTYDNSAENPANPFNPPLRVTWGLESTDEMAAVTWVVAPAKAKDIGKLDRSLKALERNAWRNRKPRKPLTMYERAVRLDRSGNSNGKIERQEMPEKYRNAILKLDRNQDGVVDEAELELLKKLSGHRGR